MPERRQDDAQVIERLTRIEERGEAVCSSIERIERRLFGNGQQGEIPKLWGEVSGVKKRVGSLENWKWYVLGTCGGVAALAALLYHLRVIG